MGDKDEILADSEPRVDEAQNELDLFGIDPEAIQNEQKKEEDPSGGGLMDDLLDLNFDQASPEPKEPA